MEYIGSLIYDKVVLEDDVRLVIYGNGKMGRKLYDFLESIDRLDKIDCICDANVDFWGSMYKGVPIISPEEAIREKKDCHFLTVGKYAGEQVMLLQKSGIKNIHTILEL